MMIYGNVIPNADVIYKLGLALGMPVLSTAGAAIKDALAKSTPNITAPPMLRPR